jgi:hypothetical protein
MLDRQPPPGVQIFDFKTSQVCKQSSVHTMTPRWQNGKMAVAINTKQQ